MGTLYFLKAMVAVYSEAERITWEYNKRNRVVRGVRYSKCFDRPEDVYIMTYYPNDTTIKRREVINSEGNRTTTDFDKTTRKLQEKEIEYNAETTLDIYTYEEWKGETKKAKGDKGVIKQTKRAKF